MKKKKKHLPRWIGSKLNVVCMTAKALDENRKERKKKKKKKVENAKAK